MLDEILSHAYVNAKEKRIIIPEGVRRIGIEAFALSNIEEIVIPESVHYIASSVFMNCNNLKKVIFETNNCHINHDAFVNCRNLETVENFPDNDCIEENMFRDCESLKNITFSNNSIKVIAGGAFCDCKSLTEFTLPQSLEYIKDDAFYNCIQLKKININKKLSYIFFNAFKNCINLEKLDFSQTNINSIEKYAFANCEKLSEIIFSNVHNINVSAFEECYNLKQIIMPKDCCDIYSDFYCEYKGIIINSSSLDDLLNAGKSLKEISKIYKNDDYLR